VCGADQWGRRSCCCIPHTATSLRPTWSPDPLQALPNRTRSSIYSHLMRMWSVTTKTVGPAREGSMNALCTTLTPNSPTLHQQRTSTRGTHPPRTPPAPPPRVRPSAPAAGTRACCCAQRQLARPSPAPALTRRAPSRPWRTRSCVRTWPRTAPRGGATCARRWGGCPPAVGTGGATCAWATRAGTSRVGGGSCTGRAPPAGYACVSRRRPGAQPPRPLPVCVGHCLRRGSRRGRAAFFCRLHAIRGSVQSPSLSGF